MKITTFKVFLGLSILFFLYLLAAMVDSVGEPPKDCKPITAITALSVYWTILGIYLLGLLTGLNRKDKINIQ
jgi:hypothetical protein